MLSSNDILFINNSVERFGGSSGIRDRGLLESAISRYEHVKNYGDSDPIMAMVEGIIRNHPFVDGNKRTALVTLAACHAINGNGMFIDGGSIAAMIDGLAARRVDPDYISAYIDENTYDYMWRGVDHLLENNPELSRALDLLARKDSGELTEEEEKLFA